MKGIQVSISDFAEQQKEDKTQWENKTQPPVETSDTTVTPSPATAPSAESTTTVNTTPSTNSTVDNVINNILGKIGNIGDSANLKVMIIGDPGSTKSSFGATAPNNLIIDAEDGAMAAKNSPHGIADNVQAYPWAGFDDLRNLVGLLLQNHPALDPYKVITMDTLSEVHKRGLQEVMAREKARRPSINEFVPETEHHTENNERIVRLVRALRDTNRDLIIISHARTVEPKGKAAKTYADFSESLSNKIMALMDVVGYMFWKEVDNKPTPVMRLISDGQIHCKNRLGMPEEIVNPTYSVIKQAWEASKNK